jgi:hypothetical protein
MIVLAPWNGTIISVADIAVYVPVTLCAGALATSLVVL